MKMLEFTLNCKPTAQQRPRHMRTKSGIDLTYKSATQKSNEATLEALLMPYVPPNAFIGALELRFCAVMPIPSSASKKEKIAMLCGEILPVKKPDLDNLAKQLKDAMTRLCFWQDDKQIVKLVCEKVYGERPEWQIAVCKIGRKKQDMAAENIPLLTYCGQVNG